MPYYKDANNHLHFLDSEKFEYLLPVGCVQITEAEADAIRHAPLTIEQQAAAYLVAVQNWLDDGAKAKNYDDIVSACSYAGAPNAFQAEGVSFLEWRAAVWSRYYELMAQVQGGTLQPPTLAELLAMLPTRVLP